MPATKQRQATFFSKCNNLRLILKPQIEDVLAGGVIRTVSKEEVVEFDGGYFRTGDPELIEHLRGRGDFNRDYVEIDSSIAAPLPDEELLRIAQLAAEADVEGLEGLVEAEEAEYARPVVLRSAQKALEALKKK